MRLLDPKLDVVFKLLFAAPRHESLLIAFLTDVLCPIKDIVSVKVLNPDIPKEFTTEKEIILDVRATLSDGCIVDIEMQSRRTAALRERLLYYWARAFGAQLEVSDQYRSLAPCLGIYVLDFRELAGQNFHSIFTLCNPETSEVFSHALEMHFLELPKLQPAASVDPAWHWGRFFRVRSEQELEQLAMSSPTLKQASDALWWVSNDPNSRQLAEMREMSERAHRHTMAATREEGREEGREMGFTEGLRVQIRSLAKVLDIELDPEKQDSLERMGSDELQVLAETLIRDRAWP
jgi:predicted transposase/invertase (TIGR01784 family)